MEKILQAFSISNAVVDLIECCSLPYIYTPEKKTINIDYYIDIFYVKHGVVDMTLNKTSSKQVNEGEIFILSIQHDDHFILSGQKDSIVIHIKILPYGLYKDLVMCQDSRNHLKYLKEELSELLSVGIELIELLFFIEKNGNDLYSPLKTPIAIFFIQAYLTHNPGSLFTLKSDKHHFSALILDIIKRPSYPWKVKDMAKAYEMNTNVFINEFRRVSGLTPCCFLKKIRLGRALQLLKNTRKPIAEISKECGYNSHASFTFYIKKEFGITPIKIRKNQNNQP
ncbi:helix-turn-helix transcriptional regulator [Salmonella enterica]|nr:AraC family transcriptional regulator [Salmonella enterica]EEJ9028849.1 helix-turn-helix transcriptional regulator [Salmonella enterica subsp. enterica]ELC5052868.1 helix-turn-helix transcriptional regulator [Salmonella enterica]